MLVKNLVHAIEQIVPLRERIAVCRVTVTGVETGVAENVDAFVERVLEVAQSFEDALPGVPDAELGEFAAVISVRVVV